MKVGTKEIPEYRMSSGLLSDLKILFEKFGRDEIELPTASEILGHKSSKSGTFLYKIAAFRAYGLVDGRGKIAVTDIGENIVFKKDDISYNNALIKAVTKIPLWSILFDKYTKNGKDIKDDDFWLELKNQCELTIEQAKNLAPEILKAYRDDTRLITMSLIMEKRESQVPVQNEPQKPIGGHNAQPDDDTLIISYGKYSVTLPKEYSERDEVGEILKSMIDLSLKQKKARDQQIPEQTQE